MAAAVAVAVVLLARVSVAQHIASAGVISSVKQARAGVISSVKQALVSVIYYVIASL